MPLIKLLERCCKIKFDDETKELLKVCFDKLNNEQYNKLYNNLYSKLYKSKFNVINNIKIRISSIKESN